MLVLKTKEPMRYLITIVIAALSLNSFAQGDFEIPQVPIDDRYNKPCYKYALMGNENIESTPMGMINGLAFNSILQSSSLGYEEVIGLTQYDLQTNASIDDRLVGSGDAISAGWTMRLETGCFPDRGTGYNFFDGENWDEQPYERIESVRCGWPSIAQTGSGLELSVTHTGNAPFLMTSRALGTSDAWSELSIPMDGPSGVLWPRVATSGTDGNTIHVIGISTPVANGGALFQGQDGALLYYRSQDAGVTWEQFTFPALNITNFDGFRADTYAIHARDGVVAFAIFNDLMDTFVMISEDNGDNWEYTPIIDFPVDNYVIDTGLPLDLGEDYNGDGIFQEYFNSDGAGDVHIDQNGLVHVVFGGMYYMDADTEDDNFTYFPGTNGLEYWNQSYGLDNSLTIAYAYDIDESGTLDLEDDIAAYYVNLAGIPSMGSDVDGRLYVSYSAIMENFSSGTQNYRHVYVVQSSDGGNSWNSGTACDLTPSLTFPGLENVFASMNPNVGDSLELIYQRDFEPGLHVRGDLDAIANNDIVSLRVPISWLEACAVLDVDGCTDLQACNYNPVATIDDGSCEYSCYGCLDENACNYDLSSTIDDGLCEYESCACPYELNGDGVVGSADVLIMLSEYNCLSNCTADVDDDGAVTVTDLLALLAAFGETCENQGFQDCAGVLGGDAVLDECGVCGGDNSTCADECGVPYGNNSTCFISCGDLVSHEGYDYSTVQIGEQCWFSENCRYLPVVYPSSEASQTSPYYYVYGYQGTDVEAAKATSNYETYGVLYNWPAVMSECICPSGWHVPSDGEFTQLTDFLGGESVAGYYMKSTSGWYNNGNGSNSSGFNGLPGGWYAYSVNFYYNGLYGNWWSTSESGTGPSSWKIQLFYGDDHVYRFINVLNDGFSARCVRD